jgi:hypothetical protein
MYSQTRPEVESFPKDHRVISGLLFEAARIICFLPPLFNAAIPEFKPRHYLQAF